MSSRPVSRFLVSVLLALLPTLARADSITYTFNDTIEHFSFQTSTFLTSSQTIPISPLTLQGVTFTYASVFISGTDVCFLFGTPNLTGDCGFFDIFPINSPTSEFDMTFSDATKFGTYVATTFGCAEIEPGVCIGPPPGQRWTLTISTSTVPEPSTVLLLSSGAMGLAWLRWRRTRVTL